MSPRQLCLVFVASLLFIGGCSTAAEDNPASAGAALSASQGQVFDGANGVSLRILEVEGSAMIAFLGDARSVDFKHFEIHGTTATFPSGDFGPAECSLTLAFAAEGVDIAQKGTCKQFDHRVGGRYVVRRTNALVGTYAGANADVISVTASNDDVVQVEMKSGATGGVTATCVGEFADGPALVAECRGARVNGGCDLVFAPPTETVTLVGAGCAKMTPTPSGVFSKK